MFIGTLKLKKDISGYLRNNLFEPLALAQRHDDLAREMTRRNYNHRSPLTIGDCLDYLSTVQRSVKVDRDRSIADLHNRCPDCRGRPLTPLS